MQVEAHAEVFCRRRTAVLIIGITVILWLPAHSMDPRPTGFSFPAFKAPTSPIALGAVHRRHRHAGQARVTGLIAAPAPYWEAGTRKSSTYLARRLATAELQWAAAMMTRIRIIQGCTQVKFTLFRRTLAELFFFCCDSVAAPERPGHDDQVPE
jgi:hypothetical protein